jgi:CheY-like chemotaxis protein
VRRVLLVDDNPHAQRMGTEILAQEGYDVRGVTDGAAVFDGLREFAPDLVLADIAMPEHSGYEICERIKSDPALEHVKVVLLVGALESLNKEEAQRVRADAVLHKPLEPSVVAEIVAPLLAGTGNGTPLRRSPVKAAGELEAAVEKALRRPEPPSEAQVHAAVVLAVESALPLFVDEVTRRVVESLRQPR